MNTQHTRFPMRLHGNKFTVSQAAAIAFMQKCARIEMPVK